MSTRADQRRKRRVSWRGACVYALIAALLGACQADPEPGGRLRLEPTELELPDGRTLDVEMGAISVPWDRSAPERGELDLEVARLPRLARAGAAVVPAEPLFVLHGGPGFPGFAQYLQIPRYYDGWLAPYREVADIVIVGQRGFGTSGDTPCDPPPPLPIDRVATRDELVERLAAASRRCREHYESEGTALEGLTVLEAAADVAVVAEALGYDQISLWGISFGSHWGMTILREYPQLVARAVLSGMEGPDHTYDAPSGVLAALERIATEAAESAVWRERFEELGAQLAHDADSMVSTSPLLRAFEAEARRLDIEPREIAVADDGSESILIDGRALRDLVLGVTDSTVLRDGIRSWPSDLYAMATGNLAAAGEALRDRRAHDTLSPASFFMLDCGSGISSRRRSALETEEAVAVVGEINLYYDASCTEWDSDLGESFRAPSPLTPPTLIVQGNWDTSTPYENALELLPFFESHHFVTIEGGSHLAIVEAMLSDDGFRREVVEFVATGDFSGLPSKVVMEPLEWLALATD